MSYHEQLDQLTDILKGGGRCPGAAESPQMQSGYQFGLSYTSNDGPNDQMCKTLIKTSREIFEQMLHCQDRFLV